MYIYRYIYTQTHTPTHISIAFFVKDIFQILLRILQEWFAPQLPCVVKKNIVPFLPCLSFF